MMPSGLSWTKAPLFWLLLLKPESTLKFSSHRWLSLARLKNRGNFKMSCHILNSQFFLSNLIATNFENWIFHIFDFSNSFRFIGLKGLFWVIDPFFIIYTEKKSDPFITKNLIFFHTQMKKGRRLKINSLVRIGFNGWIDFWHGYRLTNHFG